MKKHPLALRLLPVLTVLLLGCAEPSTSTPNVMQRRSVDQHYEIAGTVNERATSWHLGSGDAVGYDNYRRSAAVLATANP